jgi:uncharacterized protein (TIGR03437 family)
MKHFPAPAIFLISALALHAQPGPPQQNGDGIWQRSALFGESFTFDRCLAHQPQTGMYHNHVDPVCLRAELNDNLEVVYSSRTGSIYQEKSSGWTHSPILGWALDGYPVYGPYGYSDPQNASSPIQRMQSSFRLRSITQRHSLPDWALALHPGVPQQLPASEYGPDVSAEYPLGRYVEDYEYVAGLGDLDQYNGRFAVTPEFPNGTYAYYVTINDDGTPAFPYMLSAQYYGSPTSAMNVTVPGSAQDYFVNGAYQQAAVSGPQFSSWMTQDSQQDAEVISGWDPAAGPSTTWPTGNPSGVMYNGGASMAALADIQRIRFTSDAVYVNSNDLAGYVMGPWFSNDSGGVFQNWPAAQSIQLQIPLTPSVPDSKTSTPGGPVGILVNGVAIFNPLDEESYSTSAGRDSGPAGEAAVQVSSASFEGGPMAAGSLVTAYPVLGAQLSTSTAAASSANWPAALGGATVTVTDAAGQAHTAAISYASPGQVNYQIPSDVPDGIASVTIAAGSATASGSIHVVDAYPNLFMLNATGLAAAQVVRVSNGVQSVEQVYQTATDGAITALPIDLGPESDQVYLVLYGSGMGKASMSAVTATIGGAAATVAYAGPQGEWAGLDQYNLLIPPSLAGQGKVDVAVTINGEVSNPVNITVQ